MKILIVDDLDQNLYMLRILLEGHGYEVVLASDGAEALEKARRDPPDIIISDILMPVMDGFTLCRKWKADECLQNIPFIFYTATYTDPKDEDLAMGMGAERFLVKPVEPDAFIEMLEGVIEEQQKGRLKKSPEPVDGEKVVYRKYSAALIRKLEEKMFDLEKEISRRRDAELRFRDLFASISDVVYTHDLNGCLLSVNPATCKLFGYEEKELIGRRITELMGPEFADAFENEYLDIIRQERFYEGTSIFHARKGTKVYLEYRSSIVNPTNEEPYISGIGRDVTARILSERELKTLQEQLFQSQKIEAIGTLSGGIAHNFNNILTGILGHVSLMMMEKDPLHQDVVHLKKIEAYVQNAVGLTKDLLGFARGGKYEIKPTALNELIKQECGTFGFTRKEIQIKEKYERKLWAVEVDRGQIQQVILNLYVNAWQAMPGGGVLFIQTENITVGEQSTTPPEMGPGRYVKLSVTDTGIGMDKTTQERIFEPFFSTKESGQGSGLGLSSVYGIIKNHGGFIDVYSKQEEGTTFNIYFPVSDKEIVSERLGSPQIRTLPGRGTILLVDDESMILDVGRSMLEKLGYKVVVARSGKEALNIFEKQGHKIDLVILDLIMPGMGGGEVYDRLNTIDADIRVLLSSGYSINNQAKMIIDRGGKGFLQKPFSFNELSVKVNEAMNKMKA